jgi:hypothetical protein
MFRKILTTLAISISLLACTTQAGDSENFVTSFYDMSEQKFGIEAIAPPNVVRELAVCKAVWLAEKKHVQSISLSNPVYGEPKNVGSLPFKVPAGSVALTATAYLTGPNPDGNPMVIVAEKAAVCRKGWDWYR